MNNKSIICGQVLSDEEKYLLSHFDDMAERCGKNYTAVFSAFLTEREVMLANEYMRSAGCRYLLYGGYDNALRKMLGIFPEYGEADLGLFPMKKLKFTYRTEDKLTHRDFLGCLMSMQIKRNLIGDIICSDGCAYVILSPVAADMATGIVKVGRVGVKCICADNEDIVREDRFTEIDVTVASMRLDAVLGAALSLSREKTAELIRSGAVSMDCSEITNVSEGVGSGKVISVRGYGRYIVQTDGRLSGKGRIHAVIKKYI